MIHITTVLQDIEHTRLTGVEEPILAYLTCYGVLRAAGDERAGGVLVAGHALLQERAAQFVDEEQQAWFLLSVPAHCDLLAAWDARDGLIPGGGTAARAGDGPRLRIVRSASA
jgi:hypothetical protein